MALEIRPYDPTHTACDEGEQESAGEERSSGSATRGVHGGAGLLEGAGTGAQGS